MLGECLDQKGKQKESIAVHVGALELIEFDDKELWVRARKALSRQVGYIEDGK